jgi:hypothetical protein
MKTNGRDILPHRRDRICFVAPPPMPAVLQNAWSGHSPDTSDELQIESTLYTQIHRITQEDTEIHMFPPVRWFSSPAINTSERRAGHVKQAHRKRCVCFTFPYSPWSCSTGQGIKNPRAAQPALHKIPLCGEYCLIKNPRCSSRKTRVCSHAPDAHTPRKTNFLLISFLNQVVMFKKMYFLI